MSYAFFEIHVCPQPEKVKHTKNILNSHSLDTRLLICYVYKGSCKTCIAGIRDFQPGACRMLGLFFDRYCLIGIISETILKNDWHPSIALRMQSFKRRRAYPACCLPCSSAGYQIHHFLRVTIGYATLYTFRQTCK